MQFIIPKHFNKELEERRTKMAIPGFLKVKGETVFFGGEGEFLLFIPEVYFDRTVAVINGEYVEPSRVFLTAAE